jgi:hypothetical protein
LECGGLSIPFAPPSKTPKNPYSLDFLQVSQLGVGFVIQDGKNLSETVALNKNGQSLIPSSNIKKNRSFIPSREMNKYRKIR